MFYRDVNSLCNVLMLVGQQEGRTACKEFCTTILQVSNKIAQIKSRTETFWYWLTEIHLKTAIKMAGESPGVLLQTL